MPFAQTTGLRDPKSMNSKAYGYNTANERFKQSLTAKQQAEIEGIDSQDLSRLRYQSDAKRLGPISVTAREDLVYRPFEYDEFDAAQQPGYNGINDRWNDLIGGRMTSGPNTTMGPRTMNQYTTPRPRPLAPMAPSPTMGVKSSTRLNSQQKVPSAYSKFDIQVGPVTPYEQMWLSERRQLNGGTLTADDINEFKYMRMQQKKPQTSVARQA